MFSRYITNCIRAFWDELKKINVMFFVFSICFGGMLVFSQKIVLIGDIYNYSDAYFADFTILDIVKFLLYFAISYIIINIIYFVLSRIPISNRAKRTPNFKLFILIFMLLIAFWLPCILSYYPGGLYSDTYTSIAMARHETALTNHHPILYTLMWRFVYCIGGLLSFSESKTIFLFTCFVSIFMGVAVAWLVYSCYVNGLSKYICILTFLYFAIFSLVPLYIVSLWKDTPFAIAVLLFSTFLFNFFYSINESNNILSLTNMIIYSALIFLVSFLRNNGLYICIATSCVILIYFIKYHRHLVRKYFILTACLFVAILTIRGPIYNQLGYNEDDKVESLGIPLQQIGYSLVNDGEFDDEDLNFLNNILPIEKWKSVYRPMIVDSVKWDSEFNRDYLNDYTTEFLKIYAKTVFKNPLNSIKAYALTTISFWDITRGNGEAYINNFMWFENGIEIKDLLNDYCGISIRKLYEPKVYLSASFFGWLMLVFLLVGLRKYSHRTAIALVPSLSLWLTILIASPLAFTFRYMFALVLTFPIAFIVVFLPLNVEHSLNE